MALTIFRAVLPSRCLAFICIISRFAIEFIASFHDVCSSYKWRHLDHLDLEVFSKCLKIRVIVIEAYQQVDEP